MTNNYWIEIKEEILTQHRRITNQKDNLSDLGGEDEILHNELDAWIIQATEEGLALEELQE